MTWNSVHSIVVIVSHVLLEGLRCIKRLERMKQYIQKHRLL